MWFWRCLFHHSFLLFTIEEPNTCKLFHHAFQVREYNWESLSEDPCSRIRSPSLEPCCPCRLSNFQLSYPASGSHFNLPRLASNDHTCISAEPPGWICSHCQLRVDLWWLISVSLLHQWLVQYENCTGQGIDDGPHMVKSQMQRERLSEYGSWCLHFPAILCVHLFIVCPFYFVLVIFSPTLLNCCW